MLNDKQINHLCLIESLNKINKTNLGYLITFKTDNKHIYTIETESNNLNIIEKDILKSLDLNNIKCSVPIHILNIEKNSLFKIKIL
jgi:hypothetical protein